MRWPDVQVMQSAENKYYKIYTEGRKDKAMQVFWPGCVLLDV